MPCGSYVSSESYIPQPQAEKITIGSIDSPAKSALAKRSVPVGAAAAAAGAVVGLAAAAAVGAAAGAAVGAVVGAAAGAVVGLAAGAAVGAAAGADVGAAGCVPGAHAASSDAPITPNVARSAERRLHKVRLR